MDKEILEKIVVPIITTVLSGIIAWQVSIYVNKRENQTNLNERLNNLLNIAMQYPFVETESFIKTWIDNKNSNEEQYIRYDLYCTMLFNLGSR